MIRQMSILSAVFVLVFSVAVEAKNLYVDGAVGNDSVSYEANSSANPWRTIGRAAWGSTNRSAPNSSQAARAGDTVLISAGTYSVVNTGSNHGRNIAYNPVNTGTSANPIIFRGMGLVRLQTTGSAGPVIGATGRNYIIWDNFYIDEANVLTWADTGPVVIHAGTGNQVLNLEIKCVTPTWWDHESNHNGIRIEAADNTTIRDCKIYGVVATDGTYGQNAAAVMLYDSNDSIIENNEFYYCGVGVFVKGIHTPLTQDRNIIRKNLIYNMGHSGIRLLSSRYAKVYQNIVRNSEVGIYFGFFYPTSDRVVNNTLVDNVLGLQLQGNGMIDETVYNNIIVGSRSFAIESKDAPPANPAGHDIKFNYNLYYNNYHHVQYNTYGSPVLSIGFSTWQSQWGKDVNGIYSNPRFVNSAAYNYRLENGSPALVLGIDILNLSGRGASAIIPAGAYISGNEIIGRTGGATPPPPSPGSTISPPTGLRIQ